MVIVVLALVALHARAPGMHVTLIADLNSVFDAPISVMKTPPLAYDMTTDGDATDADQSPGMPRDFLEEEKAAGSEEEELMSAEEKVRGKEDGIDKGVKALATYIDDELASVSKEVTRVNEEDTDAIDEIEPQQGPVGPPGVEGSSGHDALDGQPGPNGLRGPAGIAGSPGPMGPPGLAGGQGVVGHVGLGGRAGMRGQQGIVGREGRRGQDGEEAGWRLAGAKCPRGATKTMKLTDCTTKACRLETLYNGVWGSVCALDYRFHPEEAAWKKHTMDYCAKYFCNFDDVNSYICVECPNRLNTSVETSLHACHVGCQMHHTDSAGANATEEELECASGCMTTKFESATCNLECEHEHKPDWVTGTSDRATCREECKAHKANQRANGKTSGPESDVVPFFWPDPPKNVTNGTNGTNASF